MGSTSLPPSSGLNLNFLIIGAGSRGTAYAQAITIATPGRVAAIAEPDVFKRRDFARKFIYDKDGKAGYGQEFEGWEEWLAWETARRAGTLQGHDPNYQPIVGILICTLDATHVTIIHRLAHLNLHMFCEKPLALSLADCLSISDKMSQYPPKVFSVGHVLRYSPHNLLLRKMVCTDLKVGEVLSIEHTEPVGWWHFAHSYVRGNWRRETPEGIGSLLTKSCHDIDFLMWMLCSPSNLVGDTPHEPSSITSVGHLTQFKKSRKLRTAGTATNCMECSLGEQGCIYSAKKIYRDWYRDWKYTGWPLKIVLPEIEDFGERRDWEGGEAALNERLAQDWDRENMADVDIAGRSWYGRCVYEGDNNVMDDQTVVISWEEAASAVPTESSSQPSTFGRGPKTALFHMTAPTQAQCERRGRIYGTAGEISYDSSSIIIHDFATNSTDLHEISKQSAEAEESHGGGDFGLIRNFVGAIAAVDSGLMKVAEAQREFVGCDLEEIVRSHGVVFAAEQSRTQKGQVVDWKGWWEEKQKEFHL